jgi:hypothetical protein
MHLLSPVHQVGAALRDLALRPYKRGVTSYPPLNKLFHLQIFLCTHIQRDLQRFFFLRILYSSYFCIKHHLVFPATLYIPGIIVVYIDIILIHIGRRYGMLSMRFQPSWLHINVKTLRSQILKARLF